MSVINLKATDGSTVQFDVSKPAGEGGMKHVYFAPDKTYVVAWFKKPQDYNALERLEKIVGHYRESIFNKPGGAYWQDFYCWPTKIVKDKGLTAVVVPTYHNKFFFQFGSGTDDILGIRGLGKSGKWFASPKLKHLLDPRERGDWLKYIAIALKTARATRRMHAAGLAHSDLSYNNVLVDPLSGSACMIDIDGLVVPGKFRPEVLGTPEFIAPEVMKSIKLPPDHPQSAAPCRETDLHALAVLIYQYLLYRHPLTGGKVHSEDPSIDNEMTMGERALFVEHPTDTSNRPRPKQLHPTELPFGDVNKVPYTITGPYLKELFDRAFISGLHAPNQRPSADDWESALVRTADLVLPCSNPKCNQQWFVFDNTTNPKCPFCSTPTNGRFPILNLYSRDHKGQFRPDNHRIMVYSNASKGLSLFPWHVSRNVVPNENLSTEQRQPVGYFAFHGGKWLLVNQRVPGMKDATSGSSIPAGSSIELRDGLKILLSEELGGRLLFVQMTGN